MKGHLEQRWQDGKWMVWCGALGGYMTETGYSQNTRKAIKFEGPGEAICAARECGFAIVAW